MGVHLRSPPANGRWSMFFLPDGVGMPASHPSIGSEWFLFHSGEPRPAEASALKPVDEAKLARSAKEECHRRIN